MPSPRKKNAYEIYDATQHNLLAAIEKSRSVEQISVLSESILEITAQTNLHIVSRAAHTQNGNHIGKRLGRVQMTAVAGIDDRHRRVQ